MKVQWQSNQHLSNELEVYRKIINEKGLEGLYSGYVTNFMKHIVKSAYRFPMMSLLPYVYSNMFGIDYEKNKHKMKLITSINIAFVEAFVVSPIERLQVFIQTSNFKHNNYYDFYNMSRSKMRYEYFKGFSPYLVRQMVAWGSFLQIDIFVKTQIRKFYGLRDDQMITGYKLVLSSFLI